MLCRSDDEEWMHLQSYFLHYKISQRRNSHTKKHTFGTQMHVGKWSVLFKFFARFHSMRKRATWRSESVDIDINLWMNLLLDNLSSLCSAGEFIVCGRDSKLCQLTNSHMRSKAKARNANDGMFSNNWLMKFISAAQQSAVLNNLQLIEWNENYGVYQRNDEWYVHLNSYQHDVQIGIINLIRMRNSACCRNNYNSMIASVRWE